MSQENVEAFNRAVDAFDRQDFEAMLEELDVAVEWYDAVPMMLGGKATVYRSRLCQSFARRRAFRRRYSRWA